MQGIRIMKMPDCKMVSSGIGMFEDEKFERFDRWFSSLPDDMYPRDYLYNIGEKFCWLYRWNEGMSVPEEFEIVDFQGGLYTVATDIDSCTDFEALRQEIRCFLDTYGLAFDHARPWLGNIITPKLAKELLGYCQMDYYVPIQAKQ